MSAYGRNIEGYSDPIATKALSNVSKAEKKYQMKIEFIRGQSISVVI